MSQQLALNIRLREGATFAAYYAGPNQAVAHALRSLADQPDGSRQAYLWGAPATGKSHLLQAMCHQASTLGRASVYLPLARFKSAQTQVLEDLHDMNVVCIDDINAIAGRLAWERALFNLINAVRDAGHRLALASRCNPTGMTLALPDLKSRLSWGPVFHLKALDDETKLTALKARAGQRGLELRDDAGHYLLNNWRRDMGSLLEALERLDHASLAAQRRVTIPFIKTVLAL